MKYKLLGRSGMRVSELCLGAMTFGEDWGWGSSHEESRRVFDAYIEAGGNFIDTANVYTNGTSEEYVGEFVGKRRHEFVIATKYTLSTDQQNPNASGNSRKNMVQAVEDSLRRLNTDYIDLYWLHAWDYMTPSDEVMRGLDDLVRSGKVVYIGISDTPAWVVSRCNTMAELRGWSQFVALQIRYSLIDRTVERELLPMAKALDMTVTPWSILGAGVLTGKYNQTNSPDDGLRHKDKPKGEGPLTERNLAIAETVGNVAQKLGCTPSQVAVAWLLQQSESIIPIIGARTETQIRDNIGALDVDLDQASLAELDEATRIEPGFPHEFLDVEHIQKLVYGERYSDIVNHRQGKTS